MMWLWLAPLILAAVVAAYLAGHRRGSRPWREEQRQREIEARLLGREPKTPGSTAEPAVIRAARIVSTKSWRR